MTMFDRIIDRLPKEPVGLMAFALLGLAFFLFTRDDKNSQLFALALIGLAVTMVLATYLGIFRSAKEESGGFVIKNANIHEDVEQREVLRELRNYLLHARSSEASAGPVNIDDDFKTQILARLTNEAQNSLSAFIQSEVFKKAAQADQKAVQRDALQTDIGTTIEQYQIEMMSWRKNANVNLIIGLVCAVLGIGVMWQTLVTISFEADAPGSWRMADLYRFLARLGLAGC
jgi:hypothetical protein